MTFLRDWGPSPSHWILPWRLRLSRYKVVQLSCLFVLIPLTFCDRNHPRLRAEGRFRSHFNSQVAPRNCRLVSHSNTYLLIYQGLQHRRLAEDTQQHVVLLLLRLTLDLSLTTDFMISSELQWTINTVLDPDNFTDTNAEDLVSFFHPTFHLSMTNNSSCLEFPKLSTVQSQMSAYRAESFTTYYQRLHGLLCCGVASPFHFY
jgi:hypothetical protein